MAGLLYLPRLMVYHSLAPAGSEAAATFKVMERRLLNAIMTPAMVAASVGLGLWLACRGRISCRRGAGMAWAQIPVGGRAGRRSSAARLARPAFARAENRRGAGYFRVINEVPTVLMIAIVIAAVVKPG